MVPARSARIIALREAKAAPAVLSTSRHITQGAVDLVEEKWNPADNVLSGASKLVGDDPYEIRVIPGEQDWKVAAVEVSAQAEGSNVTASSSQENGLIRIKLHSPQTQTVRWSLKLRK